MKRSLSKRIALLAAVLALVTVPANAMHIAEGYLPMPWAFGWMAVCVPFVAAGFLSIKKRVAQSAAKARVQSASACQSSAPKRSTFSRVRPSPPR